MSRTANDSVTLADRTKGNPSGGSKFLFIDYETDTSHDPKISREKHTFIQRNFHRKQKQIRLDTLKSSKPPTGWTLQLKTQPSGHSESSSAVQQEDDDAIDRDSSQQGTWRSELWSVKGYLNAGFVDPFSSSAAHMTEAMNRYWGHCASTASLLDHSRDGLLTMPQSESTQLRRHTPLTRLE